MRLGTVFVGLTILTGMFGGLAGCSSEPSGTEATLKPPLTEEEKQAEHAKIKAGMKTPGGGYKGPPGIPPTR